MTSLFAKLVLVVVTLGACACALLALRQSRLQAAHELARIQLRMREHDERLWRERIEIARRVTPRHVEIMSVVLGPMRPIRPDQTEVVNAEPRIEPPKRDTPIDRALADRTSGAARR